MVRTQIQLTEAQAAALKQMAASANVSMAEIIRRSIDQAIGARQFMTAEDRRKRALSIIGAFSSGQKDIAQNHDDHLAEAYQ